MSTILLYSVKTALYLTGFYVVYFFFLSSDTRYERNRIFLLSVLLISFILPLITIPVKEGNTIYYFGKTLSEVYVIADRLPAADIQPGTAGHSDLMTIIIRIYIIGIIILAIKFLADLSNLAWLILRKKGGGNRVLRFRRFNTSGFSAMGYIFINQSVPDDEAEAIISHEVSHIKNHHFYDIILVETIKIFQWFNPAIYMINRSLRAIHEYQADAGCLDSGMPVARYQNLLLCHLLRSKVFLTSNSFSNPSLIRKRMLMMTKSRTGNAAALKLLLVFPVAAFILLLFSAFELNRRTSTGSGRAPDELFMAGDTLEIENPGVYHRNKNPKVEVQLYLPPPPPAPRDAGISNRAKAETIEMAGSGSNNVPVPKEVFVVVEEMPLYEGGDKALMEFIYSNIEYPPAAKENGKEGRVILRFAVMYDGTVDKVQVIRSVDPDLDREAVRVISMLGRWTPGRQGGKPVNVWYSVPVTFQLK